ncbi:hypothetical protein CRYUN_Cryun02cG0139100 [Craigia yunnanensis]
MVSPDVTDIIREEKFNRQLFQKLEATLLSVNAVIDDAEGTQIVNQNVKKWLNELKYAVYDAQDLLEEVATEAWQCKLAAEFETNTTKNWRSLSNFEAPLTIFNVQNVVNPRDALEAKFKDKEYLTELVLKWNGHTLDASTERDVLSML